MPSPQAPMPSPQAPMPSPQAPMPAPVPLGSAPFVCAASAGQDCTCDGTIYYGKMFVQGNSGARTTFQQLVAGDHAIITKRDNGNTVNCHNFSAGRDPARFFWKYCYCLPSGNAPMTGSHHVDDSHHHDTGDDSHHHETGAAQPP